MVQGKCPVVHSAKQHSGEHSDQREGRNGLLPKLTAEFGRSAVGEERTFTNVEPHHLHRFVADLSHDRALAGTIACGLCGKAAAQGCAR
jgi:hypothetical protein